MSDPGFLEAEENPQGNPAGAVGNHALAAYPAVGAHRAVDVRPEKAAAGHPAPPLHHRVPDHNQALAPVVSAHGPAADHHPDPAVDDHHPDLAADVLRAGQIVGGHLHGNRAARRQRQKAEGDKEPKSQNRSCPWTPNWTS